jgi:crotonobetainyl-CoA:carnitine CoA-transferase CaiB-like acyl-CoA transferase
MKPLEGVRVLDLSRYLSGPTATMLLADLGADVIKVESLPDGDPARESGPFHDGVSAYFIAANRNKRSLALDFRKPEGKEILIDLAMHSDVLVQNFKPGTIDHMGLGHEEIRASTPRLIVCNISGFGTKGPGRGLPGFDQSAQAMSGLMSVTGTPETGPLRVGIAVADCTAGVTAALGVVSALYQRERTGEGTVVETSLIESLVSLMSYQAQKYLSLGEIPGQDGNDHPLIFPQGSFPTQDQHVTIATGNQAMWRRFCQVIGAPDLAEDDRFDSNAKRMANRVELRHLIEAQLRQQPAAEWVALLNEAGIPATPIYNIAEALDSGIVRSLGMIAAIDHATIGALQLLGPPLTVGPSKEGWLRRPPPLLGEHSSEVLAELGWREPEISRLARVGVVLDPSLGATPQ